MSSRHKEYVSYYSRNKDAIREKQRKYRETDDYKKKEAEREREPSATRYLRRKCANNAIVLRAAAATTAIPSCAPCLLHIANHKECGFLTPTMMERLLALTKTEPPINAEAPSDSGSGRDDRLTFS